MCVTHNWKEPNHPIMREDVAYPAAPDSEYGREKLFSARLDLATQSPTDGGDGEDLS
jgi:GDP-D-mannose 3',5'-epimerase